MFILAAVLSAIMVVMGVWMLYMITDHPDHPCRCPRRYLSINKTLSLGRKRPRMAGMESGDKESGQDSSAAATASSAKKKKKKKSKAYFGKK